MNIGTNNTIMQELNSYNCPLAGSNMISAGAGTGKTYNIQILALRKILMGTPIEKILVVTFTELATQELQDRVRRILQNALAICDGLLKCNAITRDELANSPEGAKLLNTEELKQALPCFGLAVDNTNNLPQDELPKCLEDIADRKLLLESALRDFDNAPISTIHGFCNRMLKENTFESGIRYGLKLRKSCKALAKSLICDFYRDFCTEKHDSRRFLLLKLLKYSPDKIIADLKEILGNSDAKVNWGKDIPASLSAENLSDVPELRAIERNPIWDRFPKALQNVSDDVLLKFCDETHFNKTKALFFRQIATDRWLLSAYNELKKKIEKKDSAPVLAQKELAPEELELRNAFLETFYPAEENATETNERTVPENSIPGLLDRYRRIILKLAHEFTKRELANAKEEEGFMTFEDLLLTLKNRIFCTDGKEFRKLIREKFDCVMIDEFQDTDHTQSAIFSKLFAEDEEKDKTHLLIMIGDEKQAIYKFRGGDVQTFQKMTGSAKYKYTLKKNYRSSGDFINSMNDFWMNACQGRFFEPAEIKFDEIAVGKNDGKCLMHITDGRILQGQQLLSSGFQTTKGDVFRQMASEIIELKQKYWKATIRADEGEKHEPVKFSDIAILVRTKTDVNEIRKTLRDCGIPSVFMQAQSIFKTDECKWMLDFMDAILEPGDRAKALRLIASGLFRFSAIQLEAVKKHCLADFQSFLKEMNVLWHRKSFFSMFSAFCHTPWQKQLAVNTQDSLPQEINDIADNTPAIQIIKNADDAERSLSLLNQVAETLMKVSSERHMEPGALYTFLESKLRANQSKDTSFGADANETTSVTEEENDDEEFPVHLTTQDDAVQILTIHKSKGLEYPFVFVPNFTPKQDGFHRNSIYHDDKSTGQMRTVNIDFIDEAAQEQCDNEAIAENKRLMYVAITRAKFLCRFIGTFPGLAVKEKEILDVYKTNGWNVLAEEQQKTLRQMLQGKKSDKKILQDFVGRNWIELSEDEITKLNAMSGRSKADKAFLAEKIAYCLQNLPQEKRPTALDVLENWNQHPEILLPQLQFITDETQPSSPQNAPESTSSAIHAETLPVAFLPDRGFIPTSFSSISKGRKQMGSCDSCFQNQYMDGVSSAPNATSCSVAEAQAPDYPDSTNIKIDDDQDEAFHQNGPAMKPYDERTPIFQFPCGTSTGTCWHEIMEHLDFTQWSDVPTPELWNPVKTSLLHYNQLNNATRDQRIDAFKKMLSTVADFPFAFPAEAQPFRLRDVPKENTLREFAFTFMMREGIDAYALAALLRKDHIAVPENWSHTIARQPLTGSIDFLMQEPKSRKFFILDWKTNIIGADADNFTPEGVEAEVNLHFYSLQCVLYALAFMQYFRQLNHSANFPEEMREQFAKEAYDAFGGCADVFLRGLNAQNGNGIHYVKPSWEQLNELDKRLGVSFNS